MSETGEMSPQGVAPEQEQPQKRLEDMPEFQKLAPEQQEKILAARERMMSEAMNPQSVVSRSINEMGFFEGLKETVKPHLKKQKEIMFKELKANASLALSLIPILGQGKGLGTGLLGITVNAEKTVAQGAIKFEPFIRLKKAGVYAKTAFNSRRSVNQIVKFSPLAGEAAKLVTDLRPEKGIKTIGKGKELLLRVKSKARDIFSVVGASLHAKSAGIGSLGADFSGSAREGAKAIAAKLGVEGIQAAQQLKNVVKFEAYRGVKIAVAAQNVGSKEWYKFPLRWARSAGGEVGARWASMKAGKEAGKAVTSAVKDVVGSKNVVGKWVEGGIKRAAPTAIEATKFGKFHAFFDRWLNLTPDVPVWLSTTTGVMEFLGAHGIDAVPAVMQMGVNRYKSVMVSKDMALDVLGYTIKRGFGKIVERKQAAEVFPTSSSEAGLRGASSI